MIKQNIYDKLNLTPYTIFFRKWGKNKEVYFDQVLDLLLEGLTGPEIAKIHHRSEQTFNRAIKQLFPGIKLQGGGQTWSNWILSQSDYKKCYCCEELLEKSKFGLNKSNYDGIEPLCNICKSIKNKDSYKKYIEYHKAYWKIHGRAKNARRRAYLLQAIPPWANIEEIKKIYQECPEGFHVDHKFPLKGKNICGLHVENNLQYLTVEDNLKKGNKMPEKSS